jgi:hypothetical protein
VSRRALRALVVCGGVAGLVLMVGFDRPATRIVGVLSLLTFIAAGLFLVADPEFLGAVAPDDEHARLPDGSGGIPSPTSTTTP